MKNKFYRIISPVTFLVVLVLDISVIAYAVFAVKKLLENLSVYSVIFAIIDLFAIVVGALVSKYVISQGIMLKEKQLEFNKHKQAIIYQRELDKIHAEEAWRADEERRKQARIKAEKDRK